MFFKKFRRRKELEKLSRRGVFYYRVGDSIVKIDPLLAYVRLKETGLDVMLEDLKGALKGNDAKMKAFAQRVSGAFNVQPIDVRTGRGLTFLDMVRLFMAYTRYLDGLKKKVILLAEFAQGLPALRDDSFLNTPENSESPKESSLSDSTSTPIPPSPLPDSPPGTEQAELSKD